MAKHGDGVVKLSYTAVLLLGTIMANQTLAQENRSEAVDAVLRTTREKMKIGIEPRSNVLVLEGVTDEYNEKDDQFSARLGLAGAYSMSIHGAITRENGYDGVDDWEVDPMGMVRILELGDRDEARLRNWLMFGQWLNQTDSLQVDWDESKSTPESWAFRVNIKNRPENLASTVSISKTTHLPTAFTLSGINGQETTELSDYRAAGGQMVPFRVQRKPEKGDEIRMNVTQVSMSSIDEASIERPKYTGSDLKWNDRGSRLNIKRAATGHLLVEVEFNDEGPFWFILDTGAGGIGLDPKLAQSLKHKKVGEVYVVSMFGLQKSPLMQFESLRVGPLEIRNPITMQMDFSTFQDAFGENVQGVIGYDLFSRCVAEIDVETPAVHLFNPKEYGEDDKWQDLMINWRIPLVEAQVGDRQSGLYRLDIGAAGGPFGNVVFHSPFVDEHDLFDEETTTPFAMPPHEFRTGRIERFQLGGKEFTNLMAAFAVSDEAPFNDRNTQGNIGVGLLKHFKIVLDIQNRRFRFNKKTSLEESPKE